ncbi:THAP domain-containing protein 9 [Cyphomyrmex costatus]|uniref:THAP domain-containing protein 9 n=1 Tax=Cyphomyrmex costatus TaxID=456900 RepID=A0A151ILH4_9HYME|nr:THAP domain-containing protein 9 [Cyphomyrmex costatus]
MLARKMKRNGHYSPELRSFALTLHFYSPKAYNYVLKTWNNLLPNPSTIRNWCRVVDGAPGFTKEALDAIRIRAEEREKSGKAPVTVKLVSDDMSIRKELVYDKKRLIGGVDLGTRGNDDDFDNDNDNNEDIEPASNALMFMAVSLNEYWKVPIGYFLFRTLNDDERANLITEALRALHNAKCKVYSITFDGLSANFTMCTILGANFEYGNNFKPYFINQATGEKCFIFIDLCHAIKLVRNTFGDLKVLTTTTSEQINDDDDDIVKLHAFQTENGLTAANKLKKKHIDFKDNRMNVKLAMQTLSKGVYSSLNFMTNIDDTVRREFECCLPTANFCLQFNNMTDVLNCKNVFPKDKYDQPLTEDSYAELKASTEEFEAYINILCDRKGKPILTCARKTGFLGIIICIRNMFDLFDEIKLLGQKYLLTYKLSQDFLETFFGAIRARGGFNNNPNANQKRV